MASKMIWKPLSGAALWSGGGVGLGWILPSKAGNLGLIYSTSIVSTSCWTGSFLFLLPVGLARGAIASVQEISEAHGKAAIQKAWDGAVGVGGKSSTETTSSTTKLLTSTQGKELLETLTLGSGWKGQVVRTLASPFLPSTAQMMVRVQEALDKQHELHEGNSTTNQSDGHVVAAAAAGFVEGFLQDKKDTITMLGSLAYVAWLGVGLGIDHMYQRAANKVEAVQEQSRAQLDRFQAQLEETRDAMLSKENLNYAKKVTEATRLQVQEQMQSLVQSALETMQKQDNLNVIQDLFMSMLTMLQQACDRYSLSDDTLNDLQQRLGDFLQQMRGRFPNNGEIVEQMQRELESVLASCREILQSREHGAGGDQTTKTPWERARQAVEKQVDSTKNMVEATQMARNLQKKWQDAFRENGGDDEAGSR